MPEPAVPEPAVPEAAVPEEAGTVPEAAGTVPEAADLEYLVVVYDYGTLSPLRLAPIAAGNGCRIADVLGSDHAREMKPILEMTGTVVEVSGGDERELVARLGALRPVGILTFSEYQLAR